MDRETESARRLNRRVCFRTRAGAAGLPALLITVLLAACASPGLPDGEWQRLETAHFEVITALDEERSLEIARDLEVFRSAVRFLVGEDAPLSSTRVRVLAYEGTRLETSLDRWPSSGFLATSLLGPTVVLRSGRGFRDGASVALLRNLAQLIIAGDASTQGPLWFDRGLAEVMAMVEIGDSEVILGRPSADHLTTLRDRGLSPFVDQLATSDVATHSTRESDAFFAQSWLLTHYVLFASRNRDDVRDWLRRELRGAVTSRLDLSRGLGGGEPLDTVIESYRSTGRYPTLSLAVEQAKAGTVRKRQVLANGQAWVALGRLQLDMGQLGRARGAFARARSAEPGSMSALAGAAVVDVLEGRSSDAQAQLERVEDTTPESLAHVLASRAWCLLGLASRDANERAEFAKRARSHAANAVRRDPEGSAPVGLAAASYAIPGESAQEGLRVVEAAVQRLPNSSELQFLRAEFLERLGRRAAARKAAAAVASRASDRLLRDQAREFVEGLGLTVLQ